MANCGIHTTIAAAAIVFIVHFITWVFEDCLYQTVVPTMSVSDDKDGGMYGRLFFPHFFFFQIIYACKLKKRKKNVRWNKRHLVSESFAYENFLPPVCQVSLDVTNQLHFRIRKSDQKTFLYGSHSGG